MFGYAMRRVLSAMPIALIAVTACFFILRLAPGGPFDGERALPPTTLAQPPRALQSRSADLDAVLHLCRAAAAGRFRAVDGVQRLYGVARCWPSGCPSP